MAARGWYDSWKNGMQQPDLRLEHRGFDFAKYEKERLAVPMPESKDVSQMVYMAESMQDQLSGEYIEAETSPARKEITPEMRDWLGARARRLAQATADKERRFEMVYGRTLEKLSA